MMVHNRCGVRGLFSNRRLADFFAELPNRPRLRYSGISITL
jgi:hypothetical protein